MIGNQSHNQPLTFQAYDMVVLSAFHSILVAEFLCMNFEVKMEFVYMIFNMEMSNNKGKNGH